MLPTWLPAVANRDCYHRGIRRSQDAENYDKGKHFEKKKNKNTKELIVIEALEEEDICSEHVSIPDDEVTRKMKETR